MALNVGKISNRLSVTPDGVETLNFLRQMGGYVDTPNLDIIVLDLSTCQSSCSPLYRLSKTFSGAFKFVR